MKKILLITSLIFGIIAQAEYLFKFKAQEGFINKVHNQIHNSCQSHYNSGARENGIYRITNNGNSYDVFCDMISDGGGWTLVVAQFSNNPVINWNQGVVDGYNPNPNSKQSFILNQSQLPSHTQTAFGRDHQATFVEYFDYVYTTGNLTNTIIVGNKSSLNYRIHRDLNCYYGYHNPDNSSTSSGYEWNNTLTINRVGVSPSGYDWAFSPQNSNSNHRGYAMAGNNTSASVQNYGWTVWVR